MQKKAAEQPLVYNLSVLPAITTDGQLVVYGIAAKLKAELEDYLKSMEQYRSEKKKILERHDHE